MTHQSEDPATARPASAPRAPALRQVEPADEAALVALVDACEDWFVAATGLPSGPGDVQSLYYALPAGADPDDKRLLVAEDGGTVIGLIDVVLHHPTPDAAAVGLFLLAPAARRSGTGSTPAARLLERAAALGVRRVTATVPAGWTPGERFLASLGFTLDAATGPATRGNRRAGPREGGLRRAELRMDPPAGA